MKTNAWNFCLTRVWVRIGAACVVIFVGAALLGTAGVTRHERLREELDRVRELNRALGVQNDRLAKEARALRRNPTYIEAVIREELGWVRADETIFLFERAGP